MKNNTRFAGALALALALAGCGTPSAVPVISATDLPAIAASPQGQSVITALTKNYVPGVNAAIANASAKVASSQDAKLLAQALNWAPLALDMFGHAAGLTDTEIAEAKVGIAAAVALLRNPPADLGTAVADAAQTYQKVVAALKPAIGA